MFMMYTSSTLILPIGIDEKFIILLENNFNFTSDRLTWIFQHRGYYSKPLEVLSRCLVLTDSLCLRVYNALVPYGLRLPMHITME